MTMRQCRECAKPVSDQAPMCPHCGAPRPAEAQWNGWGWEWRTQAEVAGLPLVHIAFKYRPNMAPVVARGWLAIGQFGAGVVTIAQFGVGVVGIGQFMAGGFVLAQFAAAWSLVAQFGLYVDEGRGQLVRSLASLLGG